MKRFAAIFVVILFAPAAAAAQGSCDADRSSAERRWGAQPHPWLVSVLHGEFADISETWCRIWETQGSDRVFKIEDFGRNVFTGDGVHPVVGTIVPGGGLAGGGSLALSRASASKPLRFSGSVAAERSVSGFWTVGGGLTIAGSGERDDDRHIFATIDAARYVLPSMAFFGIGPSSSVAEATAFSLTLGSVDAAITFPLPSGFAAAPMVSRVWATASTAAAQDTAYLGAGARLQWQFPLEERLKGFRTRADASIVRYHETSGAPASFTRFAAGWTNLYSPDVDRDLGQLTIAARFIGSVAGGGDAVPVYLQPTLGGSDINGDAALRSFRDYRFRAPNAAVVQFEYEHMLGGLPVGVWVFEDVGQVAVRRSDFSVGNLRQSTGVGVTLHAGGRPVVKLYFAWGGGEGTHTTFTGSTGNLGPAGSEPSGGVFGR